MAQFSRGQIETVESPPPGLVWVSHGRLEGHLALHYSPAGAFSPDSRTLAAVAGDRIVLLDLAAVDVRKVLRPRLEGLTDLEFQSANFLSPSQLFILGSGLFRAKRRAQARATPTLAFQWDTERDVLVGKLNALGAGGGYSPPRYMPQSRHVALYKESKFDLWQPGTGGGVRVEIPALLNRPNLFEFSPDGHWLLLAQIEMDSSRDPAVVLVKEKRFVDSLRGHQGLVLCMAFSSHSRLAATSCEDGKVRIWSTDGWKLLHTLEGHNGPVHWAEFSPDWRWIASGGEDQTVRIWSARDGRLIQTLTDSMAPIRTVAFAPSGEYLAASGENTVLLWKRHAAE